MRISDDRIAITASGVDKGRLSLADLGILRADGVPLGLAFRPSAEAPLHCALYRRGNDVGAVAHVHSIAATVLSRRHAARGAIEFGGYEMAKAFRGVDTHEATISLPIFRATQDINALSRALDASLPPSAFGYLLEGHGLTAWGRDVAEAQRHLEAFEFLLGCALAES